MSAKLSVHQVQAILAKAGYDNADQVKKESNEISAIHAINQSELATEILARKVTDTMAANGIQLPKSCGNKFHTYATNVAKPVPVRNPMHDSDNYEDIQLHYESL